MPKWKDAPSFLKELLTSKTIGTAVSGIVAENVGQILSQDVLSVDLTQPVSTTMLAIIALRVLMAYLQRKI